MGRLVDLLGDLFTSADIMMGTTLTWLPAAPCSSERNDMAIMVTSGTSAGASCSLR